MGNVWWERVRVRACVRAWEVGKITDSEIASFHLCHPRLLSSLPRLNTRAAAKGLLNSLSAKFDTVELDREESGSQMQDALKQITGQRTVSGSPASGASSSSALVRPGSEVSAAPPTPCLLTPLPVRSLTFGLGFT